MKSIKVQYFALLREQAGLESEDLKVDLKTYDDLYHFLQEKHQFTLPNKVIQVAVNDEFSTLQHEIMDGARVVFIPPVAGG